MVPPSATSKRPRRRVSAPVNAPFSWPNSSEVINVGGMAAQLTLRKATSSFPVPVSPVMRTVESVGATRETLARTASNGGRGPADRLRRPDDLVEHRDALDLFAERQVLSLQLLRPLPILDVGRRGVPPRNPAVFLTKRSVMTQEPAVGSILRAHVGLVLEGLAARKLLASALMFLEVVGMGHRPKEVSSTKLFEGAAEIVERRSIRVEPPAVRAEDDDVLRNGIHEMAKFPFVLPYPLLGLPPIIDVGARSIPSDDVPLLVAQWRGAHQHPAVHTIRAAHPVFGLDRLPRRQGRAPLVHDLRHILLVQQMEAAPAKLFHGFTDVLQQRSIAEIDLPVGP